MKKTCRNCGGLADCLNDTLSHKCICWIPDEGARPMPSRAAIVELVRAAEGHGGKRLSDAVAQVKKQLKEKKR